MIKPNQISTIFRKPGPHITKYDLFQDRTRKRKQNQKKKKISSREINNLFNGYVCIIFWNKKKYPKIAHHSIWLGKRFKSLLKDIFDNKILSDDFSLYIHRPTATDQGFAPKGCDSFYVLCPVPNLLGTSTPKILKYETVPKILIISTRAFMNHLIRSCKGNDP